MQIQKLNEILKEQKGQVESLHTKTDKV